MRTALLLIAAAGLALAACNRSDNAAERPKGQVSAPPPAPTPTPPAAPAIVAPTGFQHEAGFDATGYLMPASAVRAGNFQLEHISVGAPSDFETWETGNRAEAFPPLMLHFEDVTSPRQTNELGAERHTVSARVQPTAYKLDSRSLAFAGTDPRMGPVVFQAQVDAEALRRAMSGGESGNLTVVRGTLMIGSQRFENVAFTYFAGD